MVEWMPAAMLEATTSGMNARGENSKSSSSMASMTEARGAPKVADMPAAAPLARRIFRSEGETSITWPRSEPIEPPVTMIGPSAPNGPPVPMAMAAERGVAMAVRGAAGSRAVAVVHGQVGPGAVVGRLGPEGDVGHVNRAEGGEGVGHPTEEGGDVALPRPLGVGLGEPADRPARREPEDGVERRPDAGGDLLHGAGPVDLDKDAPLAVEVEERPGALVVDVEAVADRDLVVVAPARPSAPLQEPADELVLLDRQGDHSLERHLPGPPPFVGVAGLGQRAGKAVEDEPGEPPVAAEAGEDQFVHEPVGDELAPVTSSIYTASSTIGARRERCRLAVSRQRLRA